MRLVPVISFLLLGISCVSKQQGDTNSSSPISMEEISIRYTRDSNNKAIQERDTVVLDDAWMENIMVISSTDAQIVGKEALRKVFTDQFNSYPDVNYVRTPSRIEIMNAWGMASESGTWSGGWSTTNAKIELSGTYYAKWHKVRSKWLIRTEVYTATHCKGGDYCHLIPVN